MESRAARQAQLHLRVEPVVAHRLPHSPVLAPVVGKAQKVERVRFRRPLTVRSDRFGSGERQQARLLRVEFQSVLLAALADDPVNSLRIAPMRAANHQVVGLSHRKHLARHPLLHDLRQPAVEYFVQVEVGPER